MLLTIEFRKYFCCESVLKPIILFITKGPSSDKVHSNLPRANVPQSYNFVKSGITTPSGHTTPKEKIKRK